MPNPTPTRVLRIDSSARKEGSAGRRLGDALVARLEALHGPLEVVHRDLADGLPLLNDANLPGVRDPNATPEQRAVAAISDVLVDELTSTDALVITMPIYNFHVPAAFKAWVDLVARARVTFRYTSDGPVGLLEDRPVYIVVTSGGTRLGSSLDFVSGWLRHILGFLGMKNVHLIPAHGAGFNEERFDAVLAEIGALEAPAAA